jgi:transcriptional regulator with XRE-family HTH domain
MEDMKRVKRTIAAKLKRYRLDHDLTYDAIATLAGIAAPTVYRIENGLVEPNERTLHKLSRALPGLFESAA